MNKTKKQRLMRVIEDIAEARDINLEAYEEGREPYRLGKLDAFNEVLMLLRIEYKNEKPEE